MAHHYTIRTIIVLFIYSVMFKTMRSYFLFLRFEIRKKVTKINVPAQTKFKGCEM